MRTKVLKIVAMVALIAGMAGIAYAGFLELTKTASPAIYDHAGQKITYTYEIKNTGDGVLPGPFNVSDDPIGSPPGTPFGYLTDNTTSSTNGVLSDPASATINAGTGKPAGNANTGKPAGNPDSGNLAGNCPSYDGIGSAAPPIGTDKLAFTETGTTTRTISVVTSDQLAPTTGDIIPGVMMICKYPIVSGNASTKNVTGITAIFSGNKGLWATDIGCGNGNCARIGRANGNGNKNNIPMNGSTYVVGSVTFSMQPDSELIVAHVNWPKECSPDETCFRTLSPSQTTAIPEFPTIVLPVAGALGIMFLMVRARKKANP